jgi:hypothetical protein
LAQNVGKTGMEMNAVVGSYSHSMYIYSVPLAARKKLNYMNIIELKVRQVITEDSKLNNICSQFGELLKELRKKEIPGKIADAINEDVKDLNASLYSGNEFRKLLKQKQIRIVKLVEKELKIVPRNYYRNLWLAVGLSAFGLPIGLIFGMSMKNFGLLGIGLPIGMAIGIAVGTGMDKKAAKEGRLLDVEIRY